MNASRLRTLGVTLTLTALLAGACGDDHVAGPGPDSPDAGGGGWLGGEPAWQGSSPTSKRGSADGAGATESMSGGASPAAAADTASAPVPGRTTARAAGPLRAGSVDDNADFAGYLDYVDRLAGLGITLRPIDARGRVVATVIGRSGRPVAGAEVSVRQNGKELATLRTVADGSVRVLPALVGGATDRPVELTVAGATTTAAPGDSVRIEVAAPGGAPGTGTGVATPVAIDVLFLLDATGSMGDEIDRLKTSIDSVAARLDGFEPHPEVRYAMTLYRDEGDTFVTATHDFTDDVAVFRDALARVRAGGGGDYPEALDEGLAEALEKPVWRDPSSTIQLVFLVGDAPPQIARQVPVPYPDSVREAQQRGIKIFPVASSSSDDQAEGVFRQIAQATGARFVFMSYGAGGAATGTNTDITGTDYEELALDDLVVRLVAEELEALTGTTVQRPTPPTTTTRPPGQ